METQVVTRFAATLQAAVDQALELPPAQTVDPWESPVGFQDSAAAFNRDRDTLRQACAGEHVLKVAGFSSELWARDFYAQFADGPMVAYLDSHGDFVMIGSLDPKRILEDLICQAYEDAKQDIEGPASAGYWELRQALWHLEHPGY